MLRRNLRIVQRTPIILGICERCNSQFRSSKPSQGEADQEIRVAFDAHKCKLMDSGQNAPRIEPESREEK
jgi:hypothetical protein